MSVQENSSKSKNLSRRNFLKTSGAVAASTLGVNSAFSHASDNANQCNDTPAKEENKKWPDLGYAKITLVQFTRQHEKPLIIERMRSFFEKAARYGSDLIVFPEYILGNKINIDHKRVKDFFSLAREFKMYAIAGLIENHGKRWATTALLTDRTGNLIGRYLKCHPASGPAPHYWPPLKGGDSEARGILGSQFKVFHLDFAPIGILQCYDGYFPEAWGCTSYMGAEIILWINGRRGMIEDSHCIMASETYGCVVGANITEGKNTGFAGWDCIHAKGTPEESRLFPRTKKPGDACVHAKIDLGKLRWRRKHLRTMHQRRPELYGLLTRDIKMWQNYPQIPWDYPECADLVNKAQL